MIDDDNDDDGDNDGEEDTNILRTRTPRKKK